MIQRRWRTTKIKFPYEMYWLKINSGNFEYLFNAVHTVRVIFSNVFQTAESTVFWDSHNTSTSLLKITNSSTPQYSKLAVRCSCFMNKQFVSYTRTLSHARRRALQQCGHKMGDEMPGVPLSSQILSASDVIFSTNHFYIFFISILLTSMLTRSLL